MSYFTTPVLLLTRKHSNSLLNSYDKDIEEMREKYGRLRTTVQTPDTKIRKSPEPKAGPRGTPVQEVAKRTSARASRFYENSNG